MKQHGKDCNLRPAATGLMEKRGGDANTFPVLTPGNFDMSSIMSMLEALENSRRWRRKGAREFRAPAPFSKQHTLMTPDPVTQPCAGSWRDDQPLGNTRLCSAKELCSRAVATGLRRPLYISRGTCSAPCVDHPSKQCLRDCDTSETCFANSQGFEKEVAFSTCNPTCTTARPSRLKNDCGQPRLALVCQAHLVALT